MLAIVEKMIPYTNVVQKMVELKLYGLSTVRNKNTIVFYIPNTDKAKVYCALSIPTPDTVANIYYTKMEEISSLYERHFPWILQVKREDYLYDSARDRASAIFTVHVLFQEAYKNRFQVEMDEASEDAGMPQIIVKARVCVGGSNVAPSNKWKTVCTVYETLEKFSCGLYNRIVREVQDFEKEKKIKHGLGTLLEGWIPPH
jgi:hypothetical protein